MWRWKIRKTATDPFEPSPRSEDVRGGRFWPDTLFVDVSAYPENFQYFDGDQLRILAEGDLGIFVAAAARMHEQVHWLQTAGTTFGRFLALNRIQTADLAEAILTTASARELSFLIQVRNKGRPPARLRDDNQLRHRSGYGLTLQSLFDHWWSSATLDSYLVDDVRELLGPVDPRFMVGLALRYIAAEDGYRAVFNESDEGFMERTRAFGPVDEPRVPLLRSGLKLRNIEEVAALVAQHLFNGRVARSLPKGRHAEYRERSREWALGRFMNDPQSRYTKAYYYYSAHAPRVDAVRHLELLLLLCDIAFNPRIPDNGEPLEATWADFHPVLRFERLVEALDGFRPDKSKKDGAPIASWWSEERARLVKRAGISDGLNDRTFAKDDVTDIDPLNAPTSFLRGFIGRAATNLDILRQQFPAVVASPVHAEDPGEEPFATALDAIDGPAFDPPLLIKFNGYGVPSSISYRLYADTLTAVTSRRAIHWWLAKTGALNFRGLPNDEAAQTARRLVQERLGLWGIEVPK